MTRNRFVGVVVFIFGALAVYLGYQDATSEGGARHLEGYIDMSGWYVLGGAGTAIVGALMVMFTGPKEA